jgi:ferredoxin-NADP reductase
MTEESAQLSPGVRWQKATVVDIIARTPRIKSFLVTLSLPFGFQAGQHVDLRLTAPNGYRAMRSYSIGSSPEDNGPIELAIERLDGGEVSSFFHETVTVGDEIELRGPLGGYFIWSHADGGPLLLIGGGSGVVPLMAMVRYRNKAAVDIPTVLLLSARTWEEVLFQEELLALHNLRNGFSLVLSLTREPPRRKLDYGRRIDPALIADVLGLLPGRPKHIFVCGSNAFANAAADGAVAAGVSAATVHTERYGA